MKKLNLYFALLDILRELNLDMIIYLTKTQHGFIPVYDSDRELADKIKLGEIRKYEVKKARNYKFHKKYFALLKCVFLNLPEHYNQKIKSIDELLLAVKFAIDHVDRIYKIDGSSTLIPKSIAFDKMDEFEFSTIYNKTLNVLCEILDVVPDEIEQELLNFY